MCTVSYVPQSDRSFIITSSRDELSLRPTEDPAIREVGSVKLIYPRDM